MDLKFSKHRIQILVWFLKRPKFYRQFSRETLSYFKRKQHPTSYICEEAIKWCENNSVDEKTGLKSINPNWQFIDFNEKFPGLVNKAFKLINTLNFNWGGQGNLCLNYNIANLLDAKIILETGVAYGWSSLSLLKSLEERGEGSLTSIDMPFWGTNDEKMVGCAVPRELRKNWNLISLPDRDALPKLLKRNVLFDLCHYDSDKSYEGKSWALPRIWKHINKSGILVCDDISDNLAFRDFCNIHQINPIIVKTFDSQIEKYVGIAVKKS